MALLYRSMREAWDGLPLVSGSARGLGVRVDTDPPEVESDDDGIVYPGGGGMSVFTDPHSLPHWRRPPAFGGDSDDPLWVIDENDLPEYLVCQMGNADSPHGVIEPAEPMELGDYQTSLAETRELWRKCG